MKRNGVRIGACARLFRVPEDYLRSERAPELIESVINLRGKSFQS